MVRIAERVWPAWREQGERWDEPSLLLVFSPTGDHGEAARAFRESLLEVQDAFEASAETSAHADPPFVGEWDWLRVSDGVLVKVIECDALEDVLPAVAAGLERRGVDGVFDLRERPVVATPPVSAHFLEWRMRVRGERVRREPRSYRWYPDPEAHEAVLAAAEEWCRRHGRGATESLTAGIVPPVPIEPGEDVLERIREEVVNGMYVSLSAVTADEFRSVAARASAGGVSLVVGGAWLEAGEWLRPLAELTGLLREHADLAAYAYVRRGWAVTEALLGDSLPFDWPYRADHQPGGAGFTHQAFDDVYAPDAFGVQLLGPDYAGRLPERATWLGKPAGSGAVLLEHVDLPAWFDAPFISFRQRPRHPDRVPVPAVLAEAREALAPILYSPGVLDHGGWTDAEGL